MANDELKTEILTTASEEYFQGVRPYKVVADALDSFEARIETPVDPIPDPAPDPLPNPTPNPKTGFRVFEDINYRGRPNLSALGMDPIQIRYEKTFFDDEARPGDNNFFLPNLGRVRAAARSSASITVVDIERWWGENGAATPVEGIENYGRIAQIYQANLPDGSKFGFYSGLPIRNYWAPIRGAAVGGEGGERQWRSANSDLIGIANLVDITFPSIYTFYDEDGAPGRTRLDWIKYALAQTSEAKRIAPHAPCYAFLWPEMHPGTGPIDPAFWRLQLDTMRNDPNCDGVVIWTLSSTKMIDFSRIPPWWGATVKFLETLA